MNRRNYMREFDGIVQKNAGERPRLLLHSCCGPCSSSVLELLTKYFDVTLLWYNPNLYPQEEFDRRFAAQLELIEKIVQATLSRCIFDRACFEKYSILTSSGIQRRFFEFFLLHLAGNYPVT